MNKERQWGNATIIALIVLAVVVILLSGMAIVPSALSNSVQYTNLVQAQYVGEAGVKRVVAVCNAINDGVASNWNWIGADQEYINGANAFYNVTIINSLGGGVPSWVMGNLDPDDGAYRITSIGKINGSNKKVVAIVDITNSLIVKGSLPNVSMYANGEIESDKSLTVNTNGLPVKAGGEIINIATSTSSDLCEKTSEIIPELNFNSYKNSEPKPTEFMLPSDQNFNLIESDGKYYFEGDLIVKSSQALALNGLEDGSIIFVDGDVNIDAGMNPINCNKPIMIVAMGDVTITSSSCGQVAILAMKDKGGDGGDVYINNSNLNGTMIIAEGDITLNSVNNCNSNEELVEKMRKYLNSLNRNNPSVVSCTVQKWQGE